MHAEVAAKQLVLNSVYLFKLPEDLPNLRHRHLQALSFINGVYNFSPWSPEGNRAINVISRDLILAQDEDLDDALYELYKRIFDLSAITDLLKLIGHYGYHDCQVPDRCCDPRVLASVFLMDLFPKQFFRENPCIRILQKYFLRIASDIRHDAGIVDINHLQVTQGLLPTHDKCIIPSRCVLLVQNISKFYDSWRNILQSFTYPSVVRMVQRLDQCVRMFFLKHEDQTLMKIITELYEYREREEHLQVDLEHLCIYKEVLCKFDIELWRAYKRFVVEHHELPSDSPESCMEFFGEVVDMLF